MNGYRVSILIQHWQSVLTMKIMFNANGYVQNSIQFLLNIYIYLFICCEILVYVKYLDD